ncbi:MAG: HipA domain-containing protein [Acidimicrobiales bacterium]
MADETLFVWLQGDHVATLERRRGVLRLAYTETARNRWGLGYPLVSVSLPIALRPHHGRVVERFFDGLLPEGQLRRTLAYDFRIAETDTFGLLRELGRDCAGALVLTPEPAPPSSTTLGAAPVGDDEIAGRIENLPMFPLGADDFVRVSLAGMQHKLLLVRTGRGWALPVGAPSTHIVKPAIAQFPGSVENEAFCMRLARHAGLRAATVDVERFGGKSVLVVERFDRILLPGGGVRRMHQEDLVQALGIDAGRKYESSGGPSLRQVAKLLSDWRAPAAEVCDLLRTIAYVVAVGDADHHAKNITIVHGDDGAIGLAPLYDVMCTRSYPAVTVTPAMFVNGKRDIDRVHADDLIAEGTAWGLAEDVATSAVTGVLAALPEAIEATVRECAWSPVRQVDALRSRAGSLAAEVLPSSSPAASAGRSQAVAPLQHEAGTWVHPYLRDDGTPVRGHWRTIR